MSLAGTKRGAALILALILLVLMTGFGLAFLRLSQTEIQIASNHRESLVALYLAESGVDEVIGWFTSPERAPEDLPIWKQMLCNGDRDHPDFWTRTVPDYLLPSAEGGEVVEIRLYSPRDPGGICTVESRAVSNGGGKGIVAVELAPNPMGPLSAAIGVRDDQLDDGPTLAHWGNILYGKSVSLGPRLDPIPIQNPTLLPNGYPYGTSGNQDPWTEVFAGRTFLTPLPQDCPGCAQPYIARPNLYQNTEAAALEAWNLEAIRRYAKRYGMHLLGDSTGLLYREGDPLGTFDELFASGSNAGLVLIEPKKDQPGAVIRLNRAFYQGYFFIIGEVEIGGNQAGETVVAKSPPWPPDRVDGTSAEVVLDEINLNGLLNVVGSVRISGNFSVYGAMYSSVFSGSVKDQLQVWYNDDYRSDIFEGQPRVYPLPGTWREID
jgi:hypothetical protein